MIKNYLELELVELLAFIKAPNSHDSLIDVHKDSSFDTGNVGKASNKESQHAHTINPPKVDIKNTKATTPIAFTRNSIN